MSCACFAFGGAWLAGRGAIQRRASDRWPWLAVVSVLVLAGLWQIYIAVRVQAGNPPSLSQHLLVVLPVLAGAVAAIHGFGRRMPRYDDVGALEQELRATLSRANAPLGMVDEQGVYRYINEAACNNFRYSPQQILGRHFRDFLEDGSEIRGAFAQAIRDGSAMTERTIIRGDGTKVVVRVDLVRIGRDRLVFTAHDLTGQVEAEAAFRLTEARLQRAAAIAGIGSWEADVTGENVWWSDQYYHLLGYEPGAIDPSVEAFMSLVHPDDRPSFERQIAAAIQHRRRLQTTCRLIRVDGEQRTFRQVMEVIDQHDGRPARLAGAMLDVTEELRLREQASQAERFEAVARATAGVAHDFSNLLSVLRNNIALAREMDAKAAGERLQKAEQTADRARELVDRLLAFSRSGATSLRPGDGGPVDVLQVAEEAVEIVRDRLPAGTAVQVHGVGPMVVRGDADDLHRLCVNLLINAGEALAEQPPENGPPRVFVTVDRADDEERPEVTLCIADNGPGIPDAVRAHAFEPFVSTRRGQGGNGLGLATVYAIARAHGGVATIDRGPEGGTVVTVTLPAASVEPA